MSKAETVLLGGFFFALFWSLFGLSVNSPLTFDYVVNQLTSAPPTLANTAAPPVTNCGWDPRCLGTSVAAATAGAVGTFIWFGSLIVWFFLKFTWFSAFIATLVLGPQQAAQAAPLIALFWGALFIYVGFEVIRIFRGNSTAGV